MDALKGRFQTTEGIWMAGCVGMEPCTLVMDMEGTDGRERGEDDTAFEKQSALFALAVSDIMLINMWCHDIGREQAANRPLLKTVFQRSASSKKQPTVVRSSTEAEYRALATVAAEITWLQMLLKDLHIALKVAPVAFCDNISATYLAYNPVLHSKSKHIAIDYHFVREKVLLGDLKVQHVPTQLQLADIFTKALPSSKFKSALSNLCLPNQTQLEGDVMVQLFSPRKTTLIFVIRDKTKTPLEHLEPVLRDDIQKIWDAVLKPEAHKETPFTDFFNVEVVALSSYEENEAQFKEQVADLRQRFHHSIAPGGLAGDRRAVVPALGFAFSAQHIWNIIKENKDLDLPAHKVMVATVRCGEIAEDKLNSFVVNKEWLDLEETVKLTLVPGFGQKLSSLLGTCLSEYDAEATYFDEGVRASKRTGLENNLLQHVQLAYQSMLGHLRSETLEKLKQSLTDALSKGKGFALAAHECTDYSMLQFNKGCLDATITQANWDISKMRDKLHRDIDAHIEAVRSAKLSELISLCEEKLNAALSAPVEALLDDAGDGTWPAIRKLLRRETEDAISGFSASLSGYELDESTNGKMISGLKDYARGVVEGKAREEAGRVLILMKDRFSTIFTHDSDSMPRVWTGKEDIKAITKAARSSSLKLLSVMAAIRLDDDADNVEKTLSLALIESGAARSTTSADPLASSTWDEVPPEKTLISPVQCKSLWRQFRAETEYTVTQAISAQEARKRGNTWLPPPWAILAIVVLGYNEFMTIWRFHSLFLSPYT